MLKEAEQTKRRSRGGRLPISMSGKDGCGKRA
jgi:hypothetical protein